MSDEQEKAIKALERAFKLCNSKGIVFCGMDCDIHAYDEAEFTKLTDGGMSVYDAQTKLEGGDNVNTSKTYMDSGGW